jgi:toxic protein SymE
VQTRPRCGAAVLTDGCIVIIKDSAEVDELKHEKESLRLQQREIKQANKNIKARLAEYLHSLSMLALDIKIAGTTPA